MRACRSPKLVKLVKLAKMVKLVKRSRDAGWDAFLPRLPLTPAQRGSELVAKGCSPFAGIRVACLPSRWHALVARAGGTRRQRDHTAAKNIKNIKNGERLGQARRGGVAVAAWEDRASPIGEHQITASSLIPPASV